MEVAELDIRIAVPDDATALAGTTRLGFESYREWAPAGWEPPPRSLEIRSIRERLRANTTWCAMALDPAGEPARPGARGRSPGRAGPPAASASPTRPSASAHTCASRAARTCGCCSCARPGGAA